jgi:hypothetical protein
MLRRFLYPNEARSQFLRLTSIIKRVRSRPKKLAWSQIAKLAIFVLMIFVSLSAAIVTFTDRQEDRRLSLADESKRTFR